MIALLMADYPQNASRGKFIGTIGTTQRPLSH
jgi:hypothetical protein